jgi:hypothetical protein
VSRVHYDCVFFWHDFDAIVCSCDFRFYDKTLQKLALDLHRVWRETIYYGGLAFGPGARPGSLVLLPDHQWDAAYEKIVRAMQAAYDALPQVLNAFLDHVHQHFPEIDMDETDAVAFKRNLQYLEGN